LAIFKIEEEINRRNSMQPSFVIKGARLLWGSLNKVLVVCAILVAGCASDRDPETNRFISQGTLALQRTENRDEISYWSNTSFEGEPRIVIDLDQQRAYFYKGDQIVGVSVVSTGRDGYDTPPGEFQITEKDREHVSSLYGDYVDRTGRVVMQNVESDKDLRPRGTIFRGAGMPYFLRINGGIGMHAGYLPGYPASHGCIRLPAKMAVQFFNNAAVGTPVEIRRALAPNYESIPISERNSDFSSIIDR
jgi:lipoprotein-anchoring transpeptidase ErfK/SrfK